MNNTSSTEKPPIPKRAAPGCLMYCVTIILICIGLCWLISGEIIIPYKGIYIVGLPARVVAVLWIVTVTGLAFPRRIKSGPPSNVQDRKQP